MKCIKVSLLLFIQFFLYSQDHTRGVSNSLLYDLKDNEIKIYSKPILVEIRYALVNDLEQSTTETIDKINSPTMVKVLAYSPIYSGYYKILYNNKIGWVSSLYILYDDEFIKSEKNTTATVSKISLKKVGFSINSKSNNKKKYNTNSTQCFGTTEDGSRCKNKVKSGKYCWHHK